MGAGTQRAIAEAINDTQRVAGPQTNLVLPGAVSAAVIASSLGGLLQRLFGYTYDAREQPYIYQTETYPLASSATSGTPTSTQVVITQDADFVASKLTCSSGVAGTSTLDVFVQLVFSNTDRQWTSNRAGVIATAINGTGQWPYILAKPWLVARNSRIQVTITSGSANARDIFLDLHGYKVLDVSAADLTTRNR